MAYQGIIKGSRTLDLAAAGAVLDAMLLGFLAYTPEQLGLTVGVYAGVRIVITGLSVYLRFQTATPVGEKPVVGGNSEVRL